MFYKIKLHFISFAIKFYIKTHFFKKSPMTNHTLINKFFVLLSLAIILLFTTSEYVKIVSRGSFYFYSTKFCFIRDCALNSVDSTYGVITFPSRIHSNEYDRVSFDLFENEYLDINMITPYPCFYYGWGIYLMDRWFDFKYQQYGSSLNDTLNIFEIQKKLKTSTSTNTKLDPYRKEIRIFISYNQNILDELFRLYGNQANVFYMSWNSFERDMIPYNATGDRLSVYFRILMPNNETLLAEYIKENPVTVYRYKMNIPRDFVKPVGVWKKRADSSFNENRIVGQEFAFFTRELTSILKEWIGKESDIIFTSLPSRHSIGYDSGWDCIKYRKHCWVDNRDTVYIGNGLVKDNDVVGYNFKNNSLLMVIGVNHTHYSNSMYSSIQLYDYTNEQGFYSFHGFENVYEKSQSYLNSCKTIYESLSGRSYQFLNEQFYCVLISRNEFRDWKLPQELEKFYKNITTSDLPYNNLFTTVERSYLQSAHTISSIYDNLQFPYGIMFF